MGAVTKFQNLPINFVCILLFLFFSISCTRKANTRSQITIRAPDQKELHNLDTFQKVSSLLLAEGTKICFAVNVVGDGIDQNNVCGLNVGLLAGSVESGQNVTVDVSKGTRSFQLLTAIVDSNSSCPSQAEILSNQSLWGNIYSAGHVRNVVLDKEEKVIEIPIEQESNSIGATSGIAECGNQPGLIRAALLSSGTIVDENLNLLGIDDSLPIWESLTYGVPFSGSTNGVSAWSFLTTSHNVAERVDSDTTPTFGNFTIPAQVRSVTQKPGTREFYGLYEDGQIVSVDPGTGDVTENSLCSLDACSVPVWIQSISIGTNQRVFGLDHGGNIYQIKNSNDGQGQVLTYLRSVSPIVSQIIFY